MSLKPAPPPIAAPPLQPPDLSALSQQRLRSMVAAGREIAECQRVLHKTGSNLVAELLRGQGAFYEWDHYPPGDVYDEETHAQYYYHAHRGNSTEHGHFHTFLRHVAPPAGPRPTVDKAGSPAGEAALSHLIALAMDAYGEPMRLFATNRWVTGETWYAAGEVVRMVDRFVIDHAYPSWPVNRWLSAMLQLFQPQIAALVRHRDSVVAAWAAARPGADPFEDRDLEITGALEISVPAQVAAVRRLLALPGLTKA